MRNDEFEKVSYQYKAYKLTNHIYHSLNKVFSKSFISSIVSNIDIDKQINVQKLSREDFIKLVKQGCYTICRNGKVDELTHIFVDVVFGDVTIGSVQSIVDDGETLFIKETPTVVHSNIAFAFVKEDRCRHKEGIVMLNNSNNLYILDESEDRIYV